MILMNTIIKGCAPIHLSFKLLKFRKRSQCYKQLWTSTNYLRSKFNDSFLEEKEDTDFRVVEEKEDTDFRVKHKAYAKFFKKKKLIQPNVELFHILKEVFELDNEESIKNVLHEESLLRCSNTHIRDTALYLREMNLTKDHLVHAPWLLLLKRENIDAKKKLITKSFLFQKFVDGVGFIIFHPELLIKYQEKFEREDKEFDPFRNKIYYIGTRLNIPVDFLTLKLAHVWQVLHIQKKNIDLIIDLLLEFEYKPIDILKDVTVFRCNYTRAKERLYRMREIKGKPLPNFWIFRCSDEEFERAYLLEKKFENYFSEDRVTVIMEELTLNKEDALDYLSKGCFEKLKPKSLRYKIAQYKKAGVKNEQIILQPALLMYSEKRIIERIKHLRDFGLMEINVNNLVSSDVLFERYVQMLLNTRSIKHSKVNNG